MSSTKDRNVPNLALNGEDGNYAINNGVSRPHDWFMVDLEKEYIISRLKMKLTSNGILQTSIFNEL